MTAETIGGQSEHGEARVSASPGSLFRFPLSRVGPFARDSERFVIRLLIGGIKKPR